MKSKLLLIAIAGLAIQCTTQMKNEGFKIVKSIPVSGNGGWDLLTVNPDNHFIYASHGDQVNIINPKTSMSEGIIENQSGTHGIAFDNNNRGYITNGKTNSVFVFDVKTKEKVAVIEVEKKPDAIIFDDFSNRIVLGNADSNSLSIINPSNLKVEKTVKLTGNPELLVSNGKGKIYVNVEDQAKIAEINVNSGTVLRYFSLGKDMSPTGLAIDKKTHLLFAGCEQHLVVVNYDSGKIVAALPIAEGCDGVEFDAKSNMVFASTYSGVLSNYLVKSKDEIIALDGIKTETGARTLAIDAKTQNIYLPTAQYGTVENPKNHRFPAIDDTFHILEVGR